MAFLIWTLLAALGTTDISAQRGRPAFNAARTTFVADNGQLLRGPFTSTEWGNPPPYNNILAIKDIGFNAIHLYGECFDINYPAAEIGRAHV